MKQVYTNLLLVAVFCTSMQQGFAQNYFYSVFPTLSSSNWSFSQPSGGTCSAPTVTTPEAIADNSFVNYASYGGLVNSALTCTNAGYVFRAMLNKSAQTVPALSGYDAGFVIQTPAAGNIASGIMLSTYLNGKMQESATGLDLYGIDAVSAVNPSYIYFKATLDFDEIQITLNQSLIPLNVLFETRVYFAQARNPVVLPVTITNFRAALQNSNVALSWTSLNEDNVSHYSIERSSNGTHYTPIATVKANGNGTNSINYSYADAALLNGKYLYRVKSVDRDGAVSLTNAVSVSISGKKNAVVYPTVLSRGQQVWIKTATASTFTITVFDMQGKMVKQERKVSGGTTSLSTAGLAAGTYLLKMNGTDGSNMQFRIIVN